MGQMSIAYSCPNFKIENTFQFSSKGKHEILEFKIVSFVNFVEYITLVHTATLPCINSQYHSRRDGGGGGR